MDTSAVDGKAKRHGTANALGPSCNQAPPASRERRFTMRSQVEDGIKLRVVAICDGMPAVMEMFQNGGIVQKASGG
jgi:hypothetical protein